MAYGVAKAAAERLAQQIAFEYGRSGIRANSVSPGSVLTELKHARMVDEDPALAARLTAVQAVDEIVTPRDVAAVVLALASDGFRMVTGQTIFVDGGLTIAMPRPSTLNRRRTDAAPARLFLPRRSLPRRTDRVRRGPGAAG